jgi:hypothetical protein
MRMIRPVLLNSCAMATTAAEAAYRIDVPIKPSRATRVLALDDGATPIVREAAGNEWASAEFYTCELQEPGADPAAGAVRLRTMDGTPAGLDEELTGVDVVVMVATSDDGAEAAAVIGAACTVRGIMTSGLILTEGVQVGRAAAALRPHARFLLSSGDEQDLLEILTALRA